MPYKTQAYGLFPAKLIEKYAQELHTVYTNELRAEKKLAESKKKEQKANDDELKFIKKTYGQGFAGIERAYLQGKPINPTLFRYQKITDKCRDETSKAWQEVFKTQRICNNLYTQLQKLGILREVEKVMRKKYMKNPAIRYFYRADPNWMD